MKLCRFEKHGKVSLQCRRYLVSERSINVDCVHPVILSLGVPFDSLQPSERFPIQDGGRNSRTKDYLALAPHIIRLPCRLWYSVFMAELYAKPYVALWKNWVSLLQINNWFMLSVRISSYGCTREVWRAREKREKLLECSSNFPSASITQHTHAKSMNQLFYNIAN